MRKKNKLLLTQQWQPALERSPWWHFPKNWEKVFPMTWDPFTGTSTSGILSQTPEECFSSFLFLNISDLFCKTMQILGWEERGMLDLYCVGSGTLLQGHNIQGKILRTPYMTYVLLLQVWQNNGHSELHLLFMDHRMKKRVSFGTHDVQELFRVFMDLLL